ncbi:MAG TPA: PD-(D/E)XK nuclease family protein [Candidatus Limnocylindrales bacterium]|nr:PD-(D/E)XK nuclease family protein [Candidatus Limnocylindrales bacterium]
MNTLLRALAGACRKHTIEQKFLLVKTMQSGHQLLESLSREGIPWINMQLATPRELALATADQILKKQGMNILTEGQILRLIDDVLSVLANNNRLHYFAQVEGAEGLAGILMPYLVEMRSAGVSASMLDPKMFVDKGKGEEIKALLAGYEQKLQVDRLADTATLYQTAIELLQTKAIVSEQALYLIPEQLEVSFLEYNFLELYTTDKRIILPEEPLMETNIPGTRLKGFHFPADPGLKEQDAGAGSFLSYLYGPVQPSSTGGVSVAISHAYGPSSEIAYLLRKLKNEKIALDQVRICHTDGGVYVPLIYSMSKEYGIPVTFAEGFSLAFTRPGKLLFGVLNWVKNSFKVKDLYQLLYADLVQIDTPLTMGYLLRQAGIGWGRERYLPGLERMENDARTKVERYMEHTPDDFKKIENSAVQLEKIKILKNLLLAIFEAIPNPDHNNSVDFGKLCLGLKAVILKYARIAGEDDAAARESIANQLDDSKESYFGRLGLQAAVKRLEQRFANSTVGSSGCKPGHIHVSGYAQGEWCSRSATFVVGLNSGSFPGNGLQDPILLDRERNTISDQLAIRAPEPARNRYRMARFLASCRGSLYLSYSCYDPIEARPVMPASLLLQVYRLLIKDSAADYTALERYLGNPAAYKPVDPEGVFSIDQWWLYLALREWNIRVDLDGVQECFPGIKMGLLAEKMRTDNLFTPYDGMVSIDADQADPTKNQNMVMSVTRLEKLAGCPFSYFLSSILGIEPPNDLEYEPGVWLNPGERGHLLHEIFAAYLQETVAAGTNPVLEKDRLHDLARALIEKRKIMIPPPSQVVFDYERNKLLRELDVFLKVEKELQRDGHSPMFLEVPFGVGADAVENASAGREHPVTIKVADGRSFKLRGFIDRIDRTARDGVYGVWDYKTGSTYGFEEGQYLSQGTHLQHALYAIAAEEILKTETDSPDSPEVRSAGYLFPTAKGEGQRFARDQSGRNKLFAALCHMFNLVSAGTFCVTTVDRCKFCDYKSVCREPQARSQLAEKMKNPVNTMLEPWKELQGIE